jgi:hypothetical protein
MDVCLESDQIALPPYMPLMVLYSPHPLVEGENEGKQNIL